jgi:hypothetical protein
VAIDVDGVMRKVVGLWEVWGLGEPHNPVLGFAFGVQLDNAERWIVQHLWASTEWSGALAPERYGDRPLWRPRSTEQLGAHAIRV